MGERGKHAGFSISVGNQISYHCSAYTCFLTSINIVIQLMAFQIPLFLVLDFKLEIQWYFPEVKNDCGGLAPVGK